MNQTRKYMGDPARGYARHEVRDPRVDAYLETAPDWQREIMQRVRKLLHEADPEMDETIKRTIQPYFVLQGNVACPAATRYMSGALAPLVRQP